jgi:hypothetical protein
MKNLISISLVVMICFLISFSNCNLKSEKQREDILAEEYNFETKGASSKGAISYGLASNSGYTIPNELEPNYIKPTFVNKLPDKIDLPEAGPTESVEEIATTTDYYDGSQKLNVVKIQCTVYSDPSECFKQSSCGWCGSSNKCILGNNIGPLQACVKSSYIFNAPIPNWSKRDGTIETKVAGMNLKIVNRESKEEKKESENKNLKSENEKKN